MLYYTATTVPQQMAFNANLSAQVSASNMLSYRSSVVSYLTTHPGTTGTVQDASLTFQAGYVRNPAWTNQITGGTLYVYSKSGYSLPAGTSNALFTATQNSPMVGINNNSNLQGPGGIVIPLPAGIPLNALVIVGN